MVRLFRRIKIGKASGENPKAFWSFAIGEFILVFLGILIALQVDNWNQERKERKLERVLLSEMLSALQSDLEDIEYSILYLEHFRSSSQAVLDFLNSELPWQDSLGIHFARLMGSVQFDINASAFESLKSIGIDLIRNDSLRQSISKTYTVAYNHLKADEGMLFDFIYDNLYPALREHVRTLVPRQNAVPVNLEELRKNNAFREDLNMAIFIYEIFIRDYNRTREIVGDLIRDMKNELGM